MINVCCGCPKGFYFLCHVLKVSEAARIPKVQIHFRLKCTKIQKVEKVEKRGGRNAEFK